MQSFILHSSEVPKCAVSWEGKLQRQAGRQPIYHLLFYLQSAIQVPITAVIQQSLLTQARWRDYAASELLCHAAGFSCATTSHLPHTGLEHEYHTTSGLSSEAPSSGSALHMPPTLCCTGSSADELHRTVATSSCKSPDVPSKQWSPLHRFTQ